MRRHPIATGMGAFGTLLAATLITVVSASSIVDRAGREGIFHHGAASTGPTRERAVSGPRGQRWTLNITSQWTTIATNPDLGNLTGDKQQPVDFAVWRAQDGSWQLWSCIRGTKVGGDTRLFYRWQSPAGGGKPRPFMRQPVRVVGVRWYCWIPCACSFIS